MALQQENHTITQPLLTTWDIDPTHVFVEFAVKHLMFATTRGRFPKVQGVIRLDENDPRRSEVQAEIDVQSIDSGVADRDAHLRSADFFDAETYPTMRFRSTQIDLLDADHANVTGDLTIRGVTRPVILEVTRDGVGQDPWGNTRASYSAETTIDRRDFGLRWNQLLETGGIAVGNTVKIQIHAEAVRRADR